MPTLVLILTVAGFTEYSILTTEDLASCDRWGRLSVAAGEAKKSKPCFMITFSR